MELKRPVYRGIDPRTDKPVLGYQIEEQFVFDPYHSTHDNSVVDPMQAYGLSPEEAQVLGPLNEALATATDAALDAGCAVLQAALGVTAGDAAAIFFSGEENRLPISETLARYVEFECDQLTS